MIKIDKTPQNVATMFLTKIFSNSGFPSIIEYGMVQA